MPADKYYRCARLKERLEELYVSRENSLRFYDEWTFMLIDAKRDVACDDIYDAFRKERVRLPVSEAEKQDCREDPIRVNRIKTIVISWRKDRRVELNTQMVIDKLTEEFGAPVNGREWPMFKVFASDDAVADWDATHPHSEPHPSP